MDDKGPDQPHGHVSLMFFKPRPMQPWDHIIARTTTPYFGHAANPSPFLYVYPVLPLKPAQCFADTLF